MKIKAIYTFIIFIFLVNTLTAQKLFIGSDVSINSVATYAPTTIGLDFKPGIVMPSADIELLWDSKKRILTQRGLKLQLSNFYPTLDNQRYAVAKTGLYYTFNFGFDYSEEGTNKIGMTGYIGPHLSLYDRITGDPQETKLVPAIGISAGAGISFKMFNHARARIMYNFSRDFKDLAYAPDKFGFTSHGFSIGISTPISKINGKTFRERSRSLKIKQ